VIAFQKEGKISPVCHNNEAREDGGINGLTPSEMFLQRLIKSDMYTKKKQESVTHVGKQNCYLSV
jgi:hypothetical protein